MTRSVLLLVGAVIIDGIIGDPLGWPHPIIYIGKWIHFLEQQIRKHITNLYIGGFLLLLFTLAGSLLAIQMILYVSSLLPTWIQNGLLVYLLSTMLAAKCLKVEVMKVVRALKVKDIEASRKYLSYLVGRETSQLSEEAIIKATIETTAENTIDGVLAPLFYMGIGLLLGVPLQMVVVYKAVNTLDSMVGYLVEPYKEIGFASAKMDDCLNYIPARLGSLCMWLGTLCIGLDYKGSWEIFIRDRRNHKSPNCGYPESVVAGALNIQLGGTHLYFNQVVKKPTIGEPKRYPSIEMINITVKVMFLAETIMVLALIGILLWIG